METLEFRKFAFKNSMRLSLLLALLTGIAILGSRGDNQDINHLLDESRERALPLALSPVNIDTVLSWAETNSTQSDANPLHIIYSSPDRIQREDLFLGSNPSQADREAVLALSRHRHGAVDFYWETPCIDNSDRHYEMLAAIANEPGDVGVIVNAAIAPDEDDGRFMSIIQYSNFFDQADFLNSTGHGDSITSSEGSYMRTLNSCLGYTFEP